VARAGAPALKERELISLADEAEYNACVQAAKDENKVVVIKFFASWCRACKAMAPKISRVAEDWPDIEFYEIMFDDNKKLCKSLGIKILPFVEIVAGTAGKVESFSCGPSKISQLQARARALAARPHPPPPSPRPLTAHPLTPRRRSSRSTEAAR
jgi:thioredoxin 1